MTEPLDELYFQWLYSQVDGSHITDPNRTYWKILKLLFTKEFVWIVPNDDNRIEDGKDLRYEFVDQSGLNDVDPGWLQLGCSMLELLVGLSRRLAFIAEGEPRDWFWRLLENVGLIGFHDRSRFSERYVEDVLDRIIWRTYRNDGYGGLFPLEHTRDDQRSVELWYQLSAYLMEHS